jgi:predicted flavoprotein YhiN
MDKPVEDGIGQHRVANQNQMRELDQSAEKAEEELKQKLDDWKPNDLILWWARWYMKTGHKRLGRLLVSIAKGRSA